jgi:hypothetical protein
MRTALGFAVIGGLVLTIAGCSARKNSSSYYDGPTVEAFSGRIVQDGKPVTFPENEEVRVQFTLIEGNGLGKSFGVPIQPDGTFSIGWMPTGKMFARLERTPKDAPGSAPLRFEIPDGLSIEAGKTAGYLVELGKDWKR